MDKEKIEVHSQSGIHNPEKILSPVARIFPKDVQNTIEHEKRHAFADPELSTKGGEFGYSAVLVKLPNGLVMASWVAWYQPWGDREPEDMMQIAEAPGKNQMSDQDIFVYEQSRIEWHKRLKEKQEEINEDNPVSILDIIPSNENEEEDEYKKRAEIIIKFSQKLYEMTDNGELPPMEELIDDEFSVIYEEYKDQFIKAYVSAEDEFNRENVFQEDKLPVEDKEIPVDEIEKTVTAFGIIYIAPSITYSKSEEYYSLPLAV